MTDIIEKLNELYECEQGDPDFAFAKEAAAEIKRLREALEIISKPTYGTELFDTDEDRAEVYWQHITRFQAIAKKALEE